MGKSTAALLPETTKLLEDLGKRIQLARRRRKITNAQMATRSGMSVVTYRNIERGASSATLGAYASVLQVLQLEQDIDKLAAEDPLGRVIQDSALLNGARRANKPKTAPPTPRQLEMPTEPVSGLSDAISSDELLRLLRPPQ